VVTHRSSWVRRHPLGGSEVFAKTYDYPTWRDRMRGLGRTTWLAPTRAARELAAMQWLRSHGFPAAEPLLVWELRRFGLLHRALLVTARVAGEPLDRLLPGLTPADRADLIGSLREWLDRLHAAGFRDRNLDLRNLIAERVATAGEPAPRWRITKIDSPRWRLRGSSTDDRLALQDRQRLDAGLAAIGLGPLPVGPGG
jgi:hypothetical protein